MSRMILLASVIAGVTAATSVGTASAQTVQNGDRSSMMQRGMEQPPRDRQAMHGGMPGMSGGMMMCPMMRSSMMQGEMMGSDMMDSGEASGGSAALFGSRVTPMMNLSVDDVRAYLASQLDRIRNKRLQIGDIKSDDSTITADIVTVDNSLVQRLQVDRHTGAIAYQD